MQKWCFAVDGDCAFVPEYRCNFEGIAGARISHITLGCHEYAGFYIRLH